MKQHKIASHLFILTVSGILGSLVGCSPEQTFSAPPTGNNSQGGSTPDDTTDISTGGLGYPNTGGTTAADTTTPGQGGAASGGASGVGGNNATGGVTTNANTGGTRATGGTGTGTKATGGTGTKATGGSGTRATGGSRATGGAGNDETGGAAATTGGATTSGNTGKTVTFSATGKASGAMSGWAYVSLGKADTITDPTCGGTPITEAAPCKTSTTWTGGVCMTGSIPALPAEPTGTDYSDNWGVSIGVNAGTPDTVTLGQSFTSITFAMTGSPLTGLRAQVTSGGKVYCAEMTPGTAIPLTEFHISCYDPSATSYAPLTAAAVPNITKVEVQVSSGSKAITVTNLCLTGITFG